MPYKITVKENVRTYTVTTPNWFCEWIVTEGNPTIKRDCYLKDDTLSIVEANDRKIIDSLLPEIINEINLAINEWNIQDDIYSKELLSFKNTPAYIAYAMNIKPLA